MSSETSRKTFLVVAGGNRSAERHFEDTIQRKRTLHEVRKFLPAQEIDNLERIYHGSNFIVWGAVPGPMNELRWDKMSPGDVVLIYNSGRIRFASETAAKVRNRDLARYFWREDDAGSTWELMYFIVNEERTDVPVEKLNPLFGYQPNYHPQGFSAYSLGHLAKCDVWVPRNDQTKQYEGHKFRDLVLQEFHQTLDVPRSIENIDVVWKFGPHSIKSAFEIEHSTAIYSGILRLSDLRAEAPNSNYPLFIVASKERKRRVFEELRRPTFSGPCLRLHEVIRFLGYQKLREIDESSKTAKDFDPNVLLAGGESVPLV